MNIIQCSLQSNFDQQPLIGTYYQADKPQAMLVMVHGMCEHRLRYHDFQTYLANHEISSLMFDTRGHGQSVQSNDELGFFNDCQGDALINDLDQIINYAYTLVDNQPVILFGHSMGSLIVRTYFKKYGYKVKGLIVAGSPSENPLVDVALTVSKTLQHIHGTMHRSSFMQKMVFGTYAKQFTNTFSDSAWLSRDQEIVKQYDDDPLCGFIFTLNGFDNLFHLLKRTYHDPLDPLVHLNTPILYLAGSKDPVIVNVNKWHQAIDHMRKLGFKQIQAKCYDNARHELLNETNKNNVYEDILQFLKRIIK